MSQRLGSREKEFSEQPGAWKQVRMDLIGPFMCRSDVNKRSIMKVWPGVIEDVYSSAVHCDIVTDYSTQSIMIMLRRYEAKQAHVYITRTKRAIFKKVIAFF